MRSSLRSPRAAGFIVIGVLALASCLGKKPAEPDLLRAESRERMAPGGNAQGGQNRAGVFDPQTDPLRPNTARHPREERMQGAGSFNGDVRNIAARQRRVRERAEHEEPNARPMILPGTTTSATDPLASLPVIALSAPAPATTASFDGLDFANWGAGHPPDTNGDVGPDHYVQAINTAVGIYRKTDGVRLAAFTFDTLMSQGHFGNLCDTENFGDPVVLYDTFEDRWIITDFAFQLDASNNVINPPGMFQCFAASKTGDPVSGGWNFYSINTAGGLGDYGKFGIWPDGLYMSVNMFDYAAGGGFQNARLYALNKAQMYAGAPAIQVVSFDAPASEFTLLPANARLQTGTPPAGSPNYFTSVWNYLNVVGVWKFHVDWNSISTSTLTGPFNVTTPTNWSQFTGASGRAPTPANALDTLYPRLMVQNQYSNISGVESLWDSHTVGASGATSAQAAVRYYQVGVTGGTVAASSTQAFTYNPDAVLHRYMPSSAVDRNGDLAIGYTASNATTHPSIRYAGRLATDPVNTITYTETTILQGTGSQTSTNRWGDYSAMTLDPNGCTFWYTSEYYTVNGGNHQTRIASFAFPECTPVTSGTLQGTIRSVAGNAPIAGATVSLGSRTTTTGVGGVYSFASLPAGTYPSLTVTAAGFVSQTTTGVVIAQGATTTQNFTLAGAASSGCFTDTTPADFQTGVPTNCDLTGTPGSVTLVNTPSINQQNLTVTSNGFGLTSTDWAGQTFIPTTTGQATRIDLNLFCSGCTGTTPNLAVSLRATSGNTPAGPDLATATITGFSSGAGGYYSAAFASPATLTAGTKYAVIVRAVSNPSAGIYAYLCSCSTPNSNPYANGSFVTSGNSGSTWSADVTAGGRDMGFKVFIASGFAASGTFVSSLKDANPASGANVTWSTLSWTASTPASTAVQFQMAASNSVNGPFTFVGPNGTAATFFSNGGSLAQFNGLRYLKYQAQLTTSNSGATPTLSDVTLCFVATGAAHAPTVTSAVTNEDIQTTSGLVIARNALDGPAVTHFRLSGISGGALFKNNGVTPIADGQFITVAEGNAGLKFTPAANLFSPATAFTFTAHAANDASGSGLSTGTAATIIVNPIADTPSVTNATTCRGMQSCTGLVISRNPADGLEVTHVKITGITGGTLFKNDGVTVVTNGTFLTFAEGNAGLKFTLPANSTTAGHFTVQASTSNVDAGLGGGIATASITVAPGADPATIMASLTSVGNRIAALQHADGGWYFGVDDTDCGAGPGVSCANTFGYTALGLLASYEHTGAPALLTAAQNAGNALVAEYTAENPKLRPYTSDVEFLVALGQVTGNATYTATATAWFNQILAWSPDPNARVDYYLSARETQGFRALAAWDVAGLIRAAKAVGNLTYANGAAARIFAREVDIVENTVTLPGWKDTNAAHRWDLCPTCGASGNAYGYDYTLLGEGSLLWAVHDLSAFTQKSTEYTAFLLAAQDPAGSWDVGDVQITSYIVMGLGSVSDPAASAAIAGAACFMLSHQLPSGGFPIYSIAGYPDGPENVEVDAEVMQALHLFFNTPVSSHVTVRPSLLASAQFTNVTAAGATTVFAIDSATAGTLPAGYTAINLAYDVTTSAAVAPQITVCFVVPPGRTQAAFDKLRVLHKEGGALVDRTILAPTAPAPNFSTGNICASVTSLSPLVLASYVAPPLLRGHMEGEGYLAGPGNDRDMRQRFAFEAARSTATQFSGRVTFWTSDRDDRPRSSTRLQSTAITSIVFANDPAVTPGRQAGVDTVVMRGKATWNGASGFTFEATAVDRGEPGKGRDTFAITVFNAAGEVVYRTNGALAGGNIQSERMPARDRRR